MTYVAAFRTHLWNKSIEQLAKRFAGNCASSRFVVLTDETKGVINVQPYEKISHTDDPSTLALPKYPINRLLWYNGDYALYFLHQALPGYDYYVVSEYDVAVNTDVDAIIRAATARGIDLLAHDIQPSTPDWPFHEQSAKAFRMPQRSLIFFLVVSRRALLVLLEARREFARRFAANELSEWPFCEFFVPSVVLESQGMRTAELREFVDVRDLRWRPHVRLEDERANRHGALVHPVLGTKQYVSAVLAESSVGDYFYPGSELRMALEHIRWEELARPMARRIGQGLLRRTRSFGRGLMPQREDS